jgi:hypothetical protein
MSEPTVPEEPDLFVGDPAELHGQTAGNWAGQVVKITSQRGERWSVELADGRRMKVPPQLLRATERPFVSTRPAAPELHPGAVVTATPPRATGKWTYPAGQRFAVVNVSERTVTIAKLGGENGRVWRIDPRACTPVPADTL